MKRFGSIRDVAQETGLSIATVSRVVNGSGKVSPATQEKVLAACKKLDYVPNPAARALSTNRSRTIAAIIPTIEHSVFAKYIASIEDALDEHNYSLVLAISDADREEELKAARKLVGMGADAFILSGYDHSEELLDLLDRRTIPYIFTSVWDPKRNVPSIGYNNYELARMAVDYLTDKGHTRLAVCHGPESESDRTRDRKRGALSFASTLEKIDFFETEMSVAGGKQAAQQITESNHNYTAVLCFSDVLAFGAYLHFQQSDIRVPSDISIMGFDNLDWSAELVPPLTTINLPARRMGQVVAQQLVHHLEHGKPVQPTQLTGAVIERDSVRAVKL